MEFPANSFDKWGKKKKKVLSFLTEHYWLLIQGYQARRPVQGRLRVHIVRPAQVQRRQWRRAPDKRGVLHSLWWVRLHLFFHHQESFLTLERLNTVPEKQGFVLHLTFCHPPVKTFNVSYFIYWMYWSLLSSSRHTGPWTFQKCLHRSNCWLSCLNCKRKDIQFELVTS